MRRENKYILRGGLIGAGVFTALDIFLQFQEHKKNPNLVQNKYNYMRTIKKGLFGFVVGGASGYLFHSRLTDKEQQLPFNSNTYLRNVLSNEHIKNDPSLFQDILKYRTEIKKWLANNFYYELASLPEDGGSFYKRTAIVSNYDLDIILPFKKTSFSSLKLMYNSVFDSIERKFKHRATISRRTKSVRLKFEDNGNYIYVDIVPGREVGNYQNDKKLNLYERPDWFWQNGSSFKIDVEKQKSIVLNLPEARKIIKLLKAYRDRNNLSLPTVIIEHAVVNALSNDQYGTSTSLSENLLNCMDYIANKIEGGRIVDVGNSNNNLNNSIGDMDRHLISGQIKSDLHRIENNPRYLAEIFEQ